MALKAFQREGLRRDKNLSDLPSPQSALNNILATPTMLGTNETFTVADLAPIQNIYITNITSSTFATLNGVTLEFTVILPGPPATIDNTSNPLPFKPLVKIKNRLDTAYFSTGEPFFFGGDGPDATYYDSDNIIRDPASLQFDVVYGVDVEPAMQIIRSGNNLYRTSEGAIRATASGNLTHLASGGVVDGFSWVATYKEYEPYLSPTLDELTLEDKSIRDNFWERGQFVYGNKVQASFVSLFGGANWQGMFKSVEPGYARFFLRTTGSTVFKFQHPLYPSYTPLKYGKIDLTWEANNGTFSAGGTYLANLQTMLSDASRRWIKVICDDNVQLQTGDVIYLEIEEGPLQARQYEIYGLTERDIDAQPQDPSLVTGKTIFFVEATTDFNLNNVNYNSIPTVNDPNNTVSGYKGIARYFPWERRPYKTYFNSTKHKFSIDPSGFVLSGNTITFSDEQIYRSIFIEDYIYDYRRRSGDVINNPDPLIGGTIPVYPVRRYKVTSCNDTNMSVGVELDPNYVAVSPSTSTNDQYGYVDSLSGQLKFTPSTDPATEEAERITNVFSTGSIDETIDTGTGTFTDPLFPNTPTQTLYYVARYGDSVPRYRYFTIDQFLERAVDYAIDWTYFSKDEDVSDTSTDKAWVLWYRNETNADYGPLNYKYLYAKDYEFYEIGDFKRFLDNSVLLYGTSREDGIDQRAFGKSKLIDKGDQYNLMYSLLPIKSEYDPPVNFNEIAKSITGSIAEGSRAVSVSDTAAVIEGNYIFDNSSIDTVINGSGAFGYRGRVIEKLFGTSLVITSKLATTSATGTNLYAVDHQGFITALKITGGSGNSWNFAGDGSEVKIGHVIVTPEDAGRSTYVRIVKVDYNSGAQTGTIILDTSIGLAADKLVLVYYDRGIDITKPLQAFCTDSGCGQHAYSGETTNTEYIAIKATFNSGSDGQLDNYFSNNQGIVQTINNNSAQVQWLLESNQVGGVYSVDENNYNSTTFKNSVVKVQWDASLGARGSASEEGVTSVPTSTSLPIGWVRGMVRLKGKIWDGTDAGNEYEYYYIVRLGDGWQSNVDKIAVPESVPGAGDANGLSRNVGFNPRAFAGSLWNVQSYTLQIQGGPANYSKAGDIANQTNLDSANSSGNTGFWRITSSFDISAGQQSYFENLDSFAPDSPSTTYRLTVGNYIRKIGGKFWWFNDFNDFQDVYSVWCNCDGSFNPSGSGNTGISNGSGRTQQLVYLESQEGPVKVTLPAGSSFGGSLNDNFKYMHYRRKQYEIVPMNSIVENAFDGHVKLINVNANTSSLVDNILQNGTNKLSVFTFANTTDNRELCCPPLDTSPPFDSSPIGLSTTVLEPDMSIDGLVNVRSINGNHPDDKIHPITLTSTPYNSTTINNAGVNKKFQVMFNGVKYDILLANSNPVVP